MSLQDNRAVKYASREATINLVAALLGGADGLGLGLVLCSGHLGLLGDNVGLSLCGQDWNRNSLGLGLVVSVDRAGGRCQ